MPGSTIAVYGGSFDPPHVAHLLVSAWVAASTGVQGVVFVPAANHALGKVAAASYAHRLAMCELLASQIRGASVSDLEGQLPAPSRTFTLLEELRRRTPGVSLRLVVGADIADEAHRWHRWDDIVALAPPIWVGRPGFTSPDPRALLFPEVSSTLIRETLSRGGDTSFTLTDAVRAYIAEHDLYAGAKP